MKLLRLYHFLPPLQGGMEKHVYRLSQEQIKLGVDVFVIFNGGDCNNLPGLRVLSQLNLRKIKPQLFREMLFYAAIIFNRKKIPSNFDALHVHGDWGGFLFAYILSVVFGIPRRCASIHGKMKNGFPHKFIYKFILARYDAIYCTGLNEYFLIKSFGIDCVFKQNSGIDYYEDGDSTGKAYDVVGVGSIIPVKNFSLFVDIARKLKKYKFLIVGGGVEENLLKSYCESNEVKNVSFAGNVSYKEVFNKMHKSKVFLSTSYSEGTPTAMLEAMACGLAVVTYKSNDYSDIIDDGVNGMIVDEMSVDKFCEAIEFILTDDSIYGNISYMNKIIGLNNSWSVVAARISSIISGEIK